MLLIGVTDLAAAARELEARCGLVSLSRVVVNHPHWGTANRIVPLGTSYVELVAVVDEATAADSSYNGLGLRAALRSEGARLAGPCAPECSINGSPARPDSERRLKNDSHS